MIYDFEDEDCDCRLCLEISDFPNSLFEKTYPGILEENKFLDTQHLQVMIPVGPFCEGHILIANKEHTWSFGHVQRDMISELQSINDVMLGFIERTYGRGLIFEHGAMSKLRRGGCCLEHAHMNVLPIPQEFRVLENASKFLAFVPTTLYQLSAFVERNEPYVFFETRDEGSFAALAPEGTTQFFRKLLASSRLGSEWDWRSNPKPKVVSAILKKIIVWS